MEDDAVGVERRADLPQLAGSFVEVFGVVRGRRFGQVRRRHSSSSSSSSPSSSCDDTNHGGNCDGDDTKKKKKFEAYYHIRSSGLRLCTALGATAAMKSAGGFALSRDDRRIQFHDREPIYYDHEPKPPGRGRGFYPANKTTKFRWNTRVGKIYVDGAHVCHSCASATRSKSKAPKETNWKFTPKILET